MQPLMIVFEGGECVGKSTVVHKLTEEYSCRYAKYVRTPNKFERMASVVSDIESQAMRTRVGHGESLVVLDRWQLISDVVYEKYCYKTTSIFEPFYPDLNAIFTECNILVVYMRIDGVELIKRFSARGDKLRTLDEAIGVQEAYDKMFTGDGLGNMLPHVILDTTNLTEEETYKKVVSIIENHNI